MTQPIDPHQSPFAAPEPGPAAGQPAPQPAQPVIPSFIPPTVAAAVARPKARSGASAGTMAFVAAIVVAGAGLGFAGGRLTAPAATPTRGNGQFAGNFPGGSFNPTASGAANRGGFGVGGGDSPITGQVTAIANGSITIQTANGQPITLTVPSTVTYHAQASAAPSDVAVGTNVEVRVSRGAGRPDASGQPAASGAPGGAGGFGGFNMTVTDITVVSK